MSEASFLLTLAGGLVSGVGWEMGCSSEVETKGARSFVVVTWGTWTEGSEEKDGKQLVGGREEILEVSCLMKLAGDGEAANDWYCLDWG